MPDIASLDKLAELMGVSIDYLLTGNENIKIEKEIEIVEKERLVEVEKPLSDEDKERILYKFRDIEIRMYVLYFVVVICALLLIISIALLSYVAIVATVGLIISGLGAIYSSRLYKKEKEIIKKYNLISPNDKKVESNDEESHK